MLNVRKFLTTSEIARSDVSCICGIFVLLENKVRLIDHDLSDPWQNTPQIDPNIPDLKYALMLKLSQMGGGSIFFHDAILQGRWSKNAWVTTRIRSRNNKDENWIDIEFTEKTILQGRQRFKHLDEMTSEVRDFWVQAPKP